MLTHPICGEDRENCIPACAPPPMRAALRSFTESGFDLFVGLPVSLLSCARCTLSNPGQNRLLQCYRPSQVLEA